MNYREDRPLIITDADNTLWDTDAVYAAAQLQLLREVEQALSRNCPTEDRLGVVREFDQAIARSHPKGLRYPPSLLAAAIARSLLGDLHLPANSGEAGLGSENGVGIWSDVVQRFQHAITAVPALRPGVVEGLSVLHSKRFCVIILTEGSKGKCARILRHYNLDGMVRKIIEARKSDRLYKRISSTLAGRKVVMVGDQLDRDIMYPAESGLITVHFPSNFDPYWTKESSNFRSDFQISDYSEISDIAQRLA